jgi:hypothetical protein
MILIMKKVVTSSYYHLTTTYYHLTTLSGTPNKPQSTPLTTWLIYPISSLWLSLLRSIVVIATVVEGRVLRGLCAIVRVRRDCLAFSRSIGYNPHIPYESCEQGINRKGKSPTRDDHCLLLWF